MMTLTANEGSRPSTPRSILRRTSPGGLEEGAERKRVTFEEGSFGVGNSHGSGGGGKAKLVRTSGGVARPCRRNKNGRGASLLRSAALSNSVTLSSGHSPPTNSSGESYDIRAPGRKRLCGFPLPGYPMPGAARSAAGGGGEALLAAGDACHHSTPLPVSGHAGGADGGGGGLVVAAFGGCTSSRGHRMFQMQKAINRAERAGGGGVYPASLGGAAAGAAKPPRKFPSPARQQQQQRRLEKPPLCLPPPQSASRASYVANAPLSNDSTSTDGTWTDARISAAAATGSLATSDVAGGGVVERKDNRRQAWGATTCSPSSSMRGLARRHGGRSSGDNTAGCHLVRARYAADSPRGGASIVSIPGCLGEGPSPQRNGGRLRYREYAAGIMPTTVAGSSPGTGKAREFSGEEIQSHRVVPSTSGASSGVNGDAGASSVVREPRRVSATTDLRVGQGAELKEGVEEVSTPDEEDSAASAAPSTGSPLVVPPSVLLPPSGLTARSRRGARESKSAWTSPTCLARWEETVLPGCTPSRSKPTPPVVTPPSDGPPGRTAASRDSPVGSKGDGASAAQDKTTNRDASGSNGAGGGDRGGDGRPRRGRMDEVGVEVSSLAWDTNTAPSPEQSVPAVVNVYPSPLPCTMSAPVGTAATAVSVSATACAGTSGDDAAGISKLLDRGGVADVASPASVTLSPLELLPRTIVREDASVASRSKDPAGLVGEMDVPADDDASESGGEQEGVTENGKQAESPVVVGDANGPSCDGEKPTLIPDQRRHSCRVAVSSGAPVAGEDVVGLAPTPPAAAVATPEVTRSTHVTPGPEQRRESPEAGNPDGNVGGACDAMTSGATDTETAPGACVPNSVVGTDALGEAQSAAHTAANTAAARDAGATVAIAADPKTLVAGTNAIRRRRNAFVEAKDASAAAPPPPTTAIAPTGGGRKDDRASSPGAEVEPTVVTSKESLAVASAAHRPAGRRAGGPRQSRQLLRIRDFLSVPPKSTDGRCSRRRRPSRDFSSETRRGQGRKRKPVWADYCAATAAALGKPSAPIDLVELKGAPAGVGVRCKRKRESEDHDVVVAPPTMLTRSGVVTPPSPCKRTTAMATESDRADVQQKTREGGNNLPHGTEEELPDTGSDRDGNTQASTPQPPAAAAAAAAAPSAVSATSTEADTDRPAPVSGKCVTGWMMPAYEPKLKKRKSVEGSSALWAAGVTPYHAIGKALQFCFRRR